MSLTYTEALYFAPFVIPLCLWTAWRDMKVMKITNITVLILLGVFLVMGLLALDLNAYGWRLAQVAIALVITFILTMIGAIGGGDAKFVAAAAAFVAPGDWLFVGLLFCCCMVVSTVTLRLVRRTSLTNLAPDWKCWSTGLVFPMGVALGATLALYMVLGLIQTA